MSLTYQIDGCLFLQAQTARLRSRFPEPALTFFTIEKKINYSKI